MREDRGHCRPLIDLVSEGGEPLYHEIRARNLWEVADLRQEPKAVVDRSDDLWNVMGDVLPVFGRHSRERFQDSGDLGIVDPPTMQQTPDGPEPVMLRVGQRT